VCTQAELFIVLCSYLVFLLFALVFVCHYFKSTLEGSLAAGGSFCSWVKKRKKKKKNISKSLALVLLSATTE
jgi:hypothetical protein